MTETLHEATLESVGRSVGTPLINQAGKKYTLYLLPLNCIFVEKIVKKSLKNDTCSANDKCFTN